MSQNIVRIDGVKWWIDNLSNGSRVPAPLCPDHNLRMKPIPATIYRYGQYTKSTDDSQTLACTEGHTFSIPRKFSDERRYIIDRIDAKIFAGMQVLNLDHEAVPIAKESIKSKNSKFFLTTQLMESKRGIQVLVYAGEKGKSGKTQIFIEPAIKRLAFDQKDLNPTEVFTELRVTFDDGSSHIMQRSNNGS